MSSNNNNSGSSNGITFFGLLTILFIGLKLTHFIDWSWWWILAPIWIPILIILAGVIFYIYGFSWINYLRRCRREKKQKELDEKMR